MTARTPFMTLMLCVALVMAACSAAGPAGENSDVSSSTNPVAEVPPLPIDASTTVPDSLWRVDGSHRGLPVGFTDQGDPFIGMPDAPLTVVEFSDYLCPFCFRHTIETSPELLEQYGSSGEVNFVFQDFPLAALHPTAAAGHVAAACVAEQGAEHFWRYHDSLFVNQQAWVGLGDPAPYLEQAADLLGVDMGAFAACMRSDRAAETVRVRVDDAISLGFRGTPSFQLVVNDTGATYDIVGAQPLDVFQAALDALLAGDEPGIGRSDAGAVSEAPSFSADPSRLDEYDGRDVGLTGDGLPYVGSLEAPVTIVELSDYACPFCARHTAETTPLLLDRFVDTGDANIVFHDFPLESLHPTAPRAHASSVCVAEQGAAFFWAYHDTLFFDQPSWASLADPGDYLDAAAASLGVDSEAYEACLADPATVATVDRRVDIGLAAGFTGTPSFQVIRNSTGEVFDLVGAQAFEVFDEFVSVVLAGGDPTGEPESEEVTLPLWVTPEGRAPDPNRPGYTVAGDPYKGSADAPLVVVEFSDFQCEECRQHAASTQPVIDAVFVDTGQVRWVFKNFPLHDNPQAGSAAVAGECAAEQGAFFEMYAAMFADQERWAVDDASGQLSSIADDLGLDGDVFDDCQVGDDAALQLVLADLVDGEDLVAVVPSFFFLFGDGGVRLDGTRDAETFSAIVQEQLDAAAAG